MEFTLNGRRYALTAERIAARLRGVAPEPAGRYAVEVGGVRYPPKQALAAALDLPRDAFTTHRACELLARVGFAVAGWPGDAGGGAPRPAAAERLAARAGDLDRRFAASLDAFDAAIARGEGFSGPSVHFHRKALALRGRHATVAGALADDDFLEAIYAALTAWGMHRMGPGNAKLLDLGEIAASFRAQAAALGALEYLALAEIDASQVGAVADRLWAVLAGLRISRSREGLVANTKALHHVLPRLVPPIDRQYTLKLFLNDTTLQRGSEAAFRAVFPHLQRLAARHHIAITERLGKGPLHTSETKVLDNAVVGYGLAFLNVPPDSVPEEA